MLKYTDEVVKNILSERGYSYISRSGNYIIASDKDDYFYRISLYSFVDGKEPNKLMNNPFALDNVRKYLKNNFPDYELVDNEYHGCKAKMRFICHKHEDKGYQYNTLDNIMNNHHACRYCGYSELGVSKRISDDVIIDRCSQLSLNYIGRYNNDGTYVEFTCNKHIDKGIQKISWDHLKSCSVGCSFCAGKHKTTEDFKKQLFSINKNITVLGEYTGSEGNIECQCNICGNKWSPIARSLLYGNGCPSCPKSKGEIAVKEYLDSKGIQYESQKTFDDCMYICKLRFDFYIPIYNLVIEYDGEQHFFPVDFCSKGNEFAENQFTENQKRDAIKNEYCSRNAIDIIRIPYTDYNRIENILDDKLSKYIESSETAGCA